MYGIICDARKGHKVGVSFLALVDRKRSSRLWWTSDDANIAICYEKKSAAEFAAKRLTKNNARIIEFPRLVALLMQQREIIRKKEKSHNEYNLERALRNEGEGLGWDAHK